MQSSPRTWTIHFDGLCEPHNPGGRIGAGWVIDAAGDVQEGHWTKPPDVRNTNNQAEWYALGFALLRAVNLKHLARPELLVIRGDSRLVVDQLTGRWRCNVPLHAGCRTRCVQLIEMIGANSWQAEWIPRSQNERADAMSRRAYVDATGQQPPERGRRSA